MAGRRLGFHWWAYKLVEPGPRTAPDRTCPCFAASSALLLLVLVEIRRLPRRMLLRSVHVLDETRFQTPASYGSLPEQPARSKMLHRIPPSRKAAFSRCSCLQGSFLVLPVLCSGRILYGRQLPLQAALSLCYVLLRMLWIKLPYDLI